MHPSFNNLLCVVFGFSEDCPARYNVSPLFDGFDYFGYKLHWVNWQFVSPLSRPDADFVRMSIENIPASTSSPVLSEQAHLVASEWRAVLLRIL